VPRLVTSAVVDAGTLQEVVAPRTGVVAERLAGDPAEGTYEYEATYGPVDGYRRTVEVVAVDGGRAAVTQTVEYRLAIPFFGWLFALPYRSAMRRLGRPRRHPWWAPPDPLDQRATRSLATLAALTAVAVYPGILLTQTIEFAREEMGFAPSSQSLALAVVRGDVVIALVMVWLADRRGRREMALLSLMGGCAFTAMGALSPNVAALAGTQLVARGLLTACGVLIGIMAAEEMPAGSRAYAVSILTASGALGAFVALCAFPIADVDVRGWRVVFALALLGVPLARVVGRGLPESRRFRAPHREVSMAAHGRRFWLLAASAFFFAVFLGPSAQYQNVFLRRELDFSAARISLFTVVTNVWGGIGIVAGGQLADLRGRRLVAAVGIVGGVGATVLMFFSEGWTVWAWSTVAAILGALTVPALGVYGPELFPTSLRGRANGIISAVGRIGSVLGLLVLAVVVERTTQLAPIMAMLAIGPAIVVVLVLAFYPETAHRELEELNPEDDLTRGLRQ
jgi:MFS family permease